MTELDALCVELTCGDDVRAELAAARLPEFGSAALEAVRSLLKAQDADVRWWAIRAMVGFENAGEMTTDMMVALEDKSDEVRQAAVMAFCHHPDPQALTLLIRTLSDPDTMTARLAANALVLLGVLATPALLDVLKSGMQPARLEAVRALAEIKDPHAIPGLMQALETDSALMQYWAGLGLERLGVGMLYFSPE
jgi:HEAT repeat protein